ncbi:MAG: DUF5330 domain-containing protein [Rhizobiaceae bacterium]|nr:DUF5330 domain-containing protein [Rhizobiaceae bacterium]
MFFLIRTAFWFSLVLLFLPLGSTDTQQVGPVQAFVAARAAIADISGFCERQPDACATGSAAIHTIGTRAQESVRIAGELLADGEAPVAAALDAEPIYTGSVPTPTPKPAQR